MISMPFKLSILPSRFININFSIMQYTCQRNSTQRRDKRGRIMGGRSAAVWTAWFVIIMAAVTFMFSVSSGLAVKSSENRDYGVFIGASGNGDAGMSELYRYKTVVIDAQNFSAEDIREIKNHGVTVYSYMNIGSIEKN